MTIDDDLRIELIEYFETECMKAKNLVKLRFRRKILEDLQNHCEDKKQVYDYLAKDFDVNWEGGPNTPMCLAGRMTFEDDYALWHPLWEAEKKRDSSIRQIRMSLMNTGGNDELRPKNMVKHWK